MESEVARQKKLMDRRKRIEILLRYADEVQFEEVRQDYETAVQTRLVPEFLPVRIKNLCENLRSALDYIAQDLWGLYGNKRAARPNVYFPIRRSLGEYERCMADLFPDLKPKNLELWKFLERMQPTPGSNERWLGNFNKLNNRSKHFDLVLHTSRSAPLGHPDTNELGPVVHLDNRTNEWIEFRFIEPDVNALALIRSAIAGVKYIRLEVYGLL